MANHDAEIRWRNARLRAWRAYGVPVEGGWTQKRSYYLLALYCRIGCHRPVVCQSWKPGVLSKYAVTSPSELEMGAVSEIVGAGLCPHFVPLLRKDPEAVEALTALELLADD